MKKWPFVLVILAIMVIPGMFLITDTEDSEAVSVTPTNSATAATLTYLSSGSYYTDTYAEHKYVNWQLDIWAIRTQNYGASFNISDTMGAMASSFGYQPSWFSNISVSDSYQNNSNMSNAGFSMNYGFDGTSQSYKYVQVAGSPINYLGDHNFSNTYATGYQNNKWMVMSTNGIDYQIRNFISIIVHVQPIPYTLTFNTNGGTFSTAPQTVFNEGTVVTLPTNITRTDYTFLGWQNTQGQYVSQVTMNGNTTVNAVWQYNYTTLTYNTNGGTFSETPQTVYPRGSIATLNNNVTRTGYTFGGWMQGSSIVTQVNMATDQTVNAVWNGNEYTVTFNANGGTVGTPSKTVTYGSQYGDLPIPTYVGYNFKGWYTDPDNGTLVSSTSVYSVVGNQTLYAHWTENVTYWSNGNPNGSVSILYHIDDPNVTNDIVTQYPLYRYDPTITDDFNTEINESFVDTGYYINVEINSVRLGANNYDAKAIVTLYDNNNNVLATETKDFGKWGSFIIKVDSVNATVSYTKVMQFRSFTDYQVMESGTILAYGSYGDFGGLVSQSLKMIPVTTEVPRQSVIQTNVFLNTYGVVLRDPSIDISQYFPELPEVRLNFYSFALYGDAMTINGHRMNVSAPNVTVYYTSSSAGNIIADGPGSGISAKSLELTNIYITWDGEKCYLTFAQDNFTVDMGTYTDKNVSFEGIWYYATAIYEPYTATEKSYEVDWWGSFDYSVFGIILASLLILGAIILKATIGGRVLDYVIIICAAIIALIIAGGLINA